MRLQWITDRTARGPRLIPTRTFLENLAGRAVLDQPGLNANVRSARANPNFLLRRDDDPSIRTCDRHVIERRKLHLVALRLDLHLSFGGKQFDSRILGKQTDLLDHTCDQGFARSHVRAFTANDIDLLSSTNLRGFLRRQTQAGWTRH